MINILKRAIPLIACSVPVLSQTTHNTAVDLSVTKGIHQLIQSVQSNDIEAISECIKYPLHRKYPIPPVESKEVFIERSKEIFDSELTSEIQTSQTEKDWKQVGWRGYMLKQGLIWVDFDGKVYGVNHFSKAEQRLRNELIQQDKDRLHESLKTFNAPVLKWKTTSALLRIDDLGDAFRLATWKPEQSFLSVPDQIISNGTIVADGNGGNHHYQFTTGGSTYTCRIEVIGGDSQFGIGTLSIQHQGQDLLEEEAYQTF